MANFAEAFAALDEYRLALMTEQQNEGPQVSQAFSAQGAFSAFATPLTNVHATGVGIRVRGGKIVSNDFVLKVYVFEKQDLGKKTPALTQGSFNGIGIDVEHLPVQQALVKKTASASSTTPANHQARTDLSSAGYRSVRLGLHL